MDPSERPRFAIYFAPAQHSPLSELGDSWLGRDVRSGLEVRQPEVSDLPGERFAALTAAPRFYGFHATLKPPFHLAKLVSLAKLEERCARFAADLPAAKGPPLEVAELDGFLALLPSERAPELNGLAAACVESFDDLREPADAADLAERHSPGLTERQGAMLERWGYPFVMEDFRFHMTLSQSLDGEERELLAASARQHFAVILEEPLVVDAISLFAQPDRRSPFRELGRFPLQGA